MEIGQRVLILPGANFPVGTTGTIGDYHEAEEAIGPDETGGPPEVWLGHARIVGERKFYWVEFDSPQFDAEGDGPCSSAEVEATFLEPIAE